MWFLTIVYLSIFTIISFKKIEYSFFLLALFLPTYLLRFNFLEIPTTFLELQIIILIIISFIKYKNEIINNLKINFKKNKLLYISILLFLFFATVSILFNHNTKQALGEWKAFYLEPIILFFIITNISIDIKKYIINGLLMSGLATSLFAIYQHFTGFFVPYAFWENLNTYRVTAWYGFPNGVGLFLAPIFAIALYNLKNHSVKSWPFLLGTLFIITSLPAIFFAKSTGALVSIFSAIFLILLFYKKTRWIIIILTIFSSLLIFNLPKLQNIKTELILQDRSGQIRIGIWKETLEYLKDHPIKGSGLGSYSQEIKTYHQKVNGEYIEIYHHPHNIFLTIWVNTGLIGLLSFIIILVYILHKNIKEKNIYNNFLLLSLLMLLITGLVDSPYIKNDLAILFWFLIYLSLSKKIINYTN